MKKTINEAILAGLCEESKRQRPARNDILLTVAVLALTIALTELMRMAAVESQSIILVYILAVLVISRFTPGYACGIAAALVSTFAYDLLITEPRLGFSFTIGYPITLISMLLVTFVTSTLAIQLKTQVRLARDKEHRTQLLYEINQKLLAARDEDSIIQLANHHLVSHLGRAAIFYTEDPSRGGAGAAEEACDGSSVDIFHTEAELKRVHSIFKRGGSDPALLFDDTALSVEYMPVVTKDRMAGLIGVSCRESALDEGSRSFLRLLTGQVALAMELQITSDDRNRSLMESEKEKMRGSLLRAISRNLNKPLEHILENTRLLEEDSSADRERLLREIREDTQGLIRKVENIHTIANISRDMLKVSKTVSSANEVIGRAVDTVRGRFPEWQFHTHYPDQELMVPMDSSLINQVLLNLLENAVKYSTAGSLILVNLYRQEHCAVVEISDNGGGVPQEVLDGLGEAPPSSREAFMESVRGIGIGLSICQAVVQAHDGEIKGSNRADGGVKFSFTLPLQDAAQ